ncbi:unnamed protein product [Closterium sp. Yama58-4]|nr:unnamed protein product [Closterium sp. Yama58-4]
MARVRDEMATRRSGQTRCLLPCEMRRLLSSTSCHVAWQHLDLTASDDLRCTNLMCPKVTEPCICRLGVALSRLPCLTSLTLAHNGLEALPDSLSSLTALRHLDLSHNRLSSPPLQLTSALPHLKSLVLSGNPCAPASTPPLDPPQQRSNEGQ